MKRLLILTFIVSILAGGVAAQSITASPSDGSQFVDPSGDSITLSSDVQSGIQGNTYRIEFFIDSQLVNTTEKEKTDTGVFGPSFSYELSDSELTEPETNYSVKMTEVETGTTDSVSNTIYYFEDQPSTNISFDPAQGDTVAGQSEVDATLETDWQYDISATHISGISGNTVEQTYSRTGPLTETFTNNIDFNDTSQEYANQLSYDLEYDGNSIQSDNQFEFFNISAYADPISPQDGEELPYDTTTDDIEFEFDVETLDKSSVQFNLYFSEGNQATDPLGFGSISSDGIATRPFSVYENGVTPIDSIEPDTNYSWRVEIEHDDRTWSSETQTFSTAEPPVLEPDFNITMDQTRFGKDTPLAESPAYYTGTSDVPLSVEDGSYTYGYEDTSWSTPNQALYYGWLTTDIANGSTETTDNLLNEEIDGRVNGEVTVDMTYSFDQLDTDGSYTLSIANSQSGQGTTVQYDAGESRSSFTRTFYVGENLDENYFTDELVLEIENQLGKELNIESVEINNVEDRPRDFFGEEFRTVALETQAVDPDDLEFWFTIDGGNATAPIQTQEVNPEFMELRSFNGAEIEEEIDREGFVATWERQNRKDIFTIPDQVNNYTVSGYTAPQSVIVDTGFDQQIILFFFDLNDQVTEDWTATNGTLYATNGNITDSVDFEFSSGIDFRNFRSSSDVETLDTTLSFDSDSSLVSDGEFVSEQNPPITIERNLDYTVLQPVEDPNGDSFSYDTEISGEDAVFSYSFRNTHSYDIRLDGELGSTQVYEPNEIIEITPTSDIAGNGGWTVGELLQENIDVREVLLQEENISKELEINGSNLERGELTVVYKLEDEFENFREVERTFEIRENSFKGKFYQFFDNTLEFNDWLTGLIVFMLIAVLGMLIIDWKISFLFGTAFGLVASIALLWTGFLPLQINLLIMVILAGVTAIALRKVIG